MSDLNNKLAVKIFDALYDDEDLKELEQNNFIRQALGFKLSTIAIIECEIDEFLYNDNYELVEAILNDSDDIRNHVMKLLGKHKCDSQS